MLRQKTLDSTYTSISNLSRVVQYTASFIVTLYLDISALSFKSVLVLGSNVDDDAGANPNMAWRSPLVNNINSNLMYES